MTPSDILTLYARQQWALETVRRTAAGLVQHWYEFGYESGIAEWIVGLEQALTVLDQTCTILDKTLQTQEGGTP